MQLKDFTSLQEIEARRAILESICYYVSLYFVVNAIISVYF